MKKRYRVILGALTSDELDQICDAFKVYMAHLDSQIAEADSQGIPCNTVRGKRRVLKGLYLKLNACYVNQLKEENCN